MLRTFGARIKRLVDRIESIQKKFLMFALRQTVRRDMNLPPYIDRCESINIESLARLRINACIFFTSDLLNGNLDAPKIAGKIIFNSHRTRADYFLIVDEHRTKYAYYEPINNISVEFITEPMVTSVILDENTQGLTSHLLLRVFRLISVLPEVLELYNIFLTLPKLELFFCVVE